MRERHWSAYLRLLPGGDNDVSSALAASGVLYVLLFLVGLAPSFYYAKNFTISPTIDMVLPVLGAGALPAFVLAAWTGIRVYGTRPIGPDQAAASLADDRTWRGDEVARVPSGAVVVSTWPRYLVVELACGSRRRLWYRAGQEERELLRLARAMRPREGAAHETLEDLVAAEVGDLPGRLLPDPAGVEACLRGRLEAVGVILTKSEAYG